MEDSRRIGTYLDAGANLSQFSGLFEYANVEASASKRQRRGQAADSGTDDYYSQVLSPAAVTRRVNLVSLCFFVIPTKQATRVPF